MDILTNEWIWRTNENTNVWQIKLPMWMLLWVIMATEVVSGSFEENEAWGLRSKDVDEYFMNYTSSKFPEMWV